VRAAPQQQAVTRPPVTQPPVTTPKPTLREGGDIIAEKDEDVPVGEWLEYKPPKSLAEYKKGFVDGTSGRADHLEVANDVDVGRDASCKRFFRVGNRGDMRGVMRPIFASYGLCERSAVDEPVDVMWTRPWEVTAAFFQKKKLPSGAIVNSVGGLPQQVGRKAALARLHVRCFKRFKHNPFDALPEGATECQFTKRSFAISRDSSSLQMSYRKFRQYNLHLASQERTSHQIWILKPQAGFNQVGIHMYSLPRSEMATDASVGDWLARRVPNGKWVLQEYIMNPLTFQDHKFDLRIWSVVTSIDPLRMHLLGTGIPKVSQWRYSNAPEHVKNQCIHTLFPGTSECFYAKDPMVKILDPYPQRTDEPYWYQNLGPAIPRGRGEAFWKTVVWPSVEHKLVEMMLLARDAILHIDHTIKRRSIRYKRIFFLQPDFVFDSRGNAFMVEVNTNGYMIGNLHKMFFNLHAFQQAMVRLIGSTGYPLKAKYHKALEEKTGDFCDRVGGCGAAEREIWELVHEEMHASRNWYRIFPSNRVAALFLQAKQWTRSITPLDLLMLEWLERDWWPTHARDENGTVSLLA